MTMDAPADDGTDATLRLRPDPASVAVARGFATQTCARWGFSDACDVIALLVSETVTNAVVHACTDIDLRLCVEDDHIRVHVIDESAAPPRPRDANVQAEGGRGLALLDALADAWGSGPWGSGKVVWFAVG